MSAQRVVILSRAGLGGLPRDLSERIRAGADLVVHLADGPVPPREAARLLADADVLASTNLALPRLDADLLDHCPRLREVVLYATGFDRVDLDLLTRRGITLRTLPDYATHAVAEHALALILTQAARVHLANDRSRGNAAPGTSLRGIELDGRTLGIIGTGRIGRRLGHIASGIGMRVVGTDIDPVARVAARQAGIVVANREAVLAEADIVAICASTIPGDGPILDAAAIGTLRPGAFVVNVGRSSRVDTAAMLTALRAGVVRGYGVDDVVADPHADADVIAEGRLVQTGHSAWWRDEVLARGSRMFAEAILAALAHDQKAQGITRTHGPSRGRIAG